MEESLMCWYCVSSTIVCPKRHKGDTYETYILP